MKIVLSLLIIAGAGTYLLASTLATGADYFVHADEIIVKAPVFKGQKVRVGGKVEKGSIAQKKGTLEYRFEVKPVEKMMKFPEAKGKTLVVAYTGIVPDTLKDDGEVIVGGRLGEDGVFVAQDLTAKCPSKYEAMDKNQGTY